MKAAVYSRFSTDRQTESSIADQVRVCTDWCRKNGAQVIARFEDQGISGAAIGNRPGLQAALATAVDVLVVMDLTRLSRSQADLPKVIDRLVHRGVRVVGVQDGYDSARKGHKLQAGLMGIIGEQFRDMVSEKTYSALESRAQAGKPTGGRAFGYREGEAAIVRRIFVLYAEGWSPKRIAEKLNREGVPSPGSSWSRMTRRRGGWAPSSISGDPKRGIGILNNEIYVGRDIWNRSKWIKDPDSGLRKSIQRPRSEWIVHAAPELRLVDQAIWDAVKARQGRRHVRVGEAVRRGMKRSGGRAARYLFSTILQCKVCGSNYVMADKWYYACSGFTNGKVCSNNQRFRRDKMQERLLTAIRTQLLSDESIEAFKKKLARRLRAPKTNVRQVQKLESEVANLTDAIAQGMSSKAVLQRLQVAEAELERLRSAATTVDLKSVLAVIPAAIERYRQMAEDIGSAPIDIERSREIIRSIANRIPVRPGDDGVPIAELSLNEELALGQRAIGSEIQIGMVAGAGFEPATFGL
jgi:site-specific DNA recombinase